MGTGLVHIYNMATKCVHKLELLDVRLTNANKVHKFRQTQVYAYYIVKLFHWT
jgi:hypothetical protein